MTAKRFNYVLGAVRLAVEECWTNGQWSRLHTLAEQYGTAGKATREEIRYTLENSIIDIIRELEG